MDPRTEDEKYVDYLKTAHNPLCKERWRQRQEDGGWRIVRDIRDPRLRPVRA